MSTTIDSSPVGARRLLGAALSVGACAVACSMLAGAQQDTAASKPAGSATLEETRLTMDKWLETQQIISRERKDWQQGKEILLGRIDLIKKEIASLEEKTQEAQASVTEASKKRDEVAAERDQLTTISDQLTGSVTSMEGEVRTLLATIPEPLKTRLQTLIQRIPEDPATTRVTTPERFQNVIGILNELNKANTEITVNYEVRTLADGRPAEVQAIYVGLAQAYYVSAGGEAGIGRPAADGWKWEQARSIAPDLTTALEILQGKHTPAFVPLPVQIR